jgi:hypothetical protein
MFNLPLETCLKAYRFISIALQYQTINLKYFYISKFYEVYKRKKECNRFYLFIKKKFWKLKFFYDKKK